MFIPQILFITSYPPRECGIATFSQDLIEVLKTKFGQSFIIKICALETGTEKHQYPEDVFYTLDTSLAEEYNTLAQEINDDRDISLIVIQHEFGFFYKNEDAFENLLAIIKKPIVLVFHTVLPNPDDVMKLRVQKVVSFCESIVVMTNNSSRLLVDDYEIPVFMINVIPHGTHLVSHYDKKFLKKKCGFEGRKVLSTFGLLSAGKSIETTIAAMPGIIKQNPETLFLVIGKTHPEVIKNEGEKYRQMLEEKVASLNLGDHVMFINRYLTLKDLLNYLQLSDIYLFTSKDPVQAVSGTFAYAMSCACPIISTPIPHALEMLNKDTGIIIDFENSSQLEAGVKFLLSDKKLRQKMSLNVLQRSVPTAWENVIIAYALLFSKSTNEGISLKWNLPVVNLDHIKRLTTDFGMIQFSKNDHPDLSSGYTLDDNARALIAVCQHYNLEHDKADLPYIDIYLKYIRFCQQADGAFLNYVDYAGKFTEQNKEVNLEDANGRAVWALGFTLSINELPDIIKDQAQELLNRAVIHIHLITSPRAMAFIIKGLFYVSKIQNTDEVNQLIIEFADRLVDLYNKESEEKWEWFESYLTYANSILPEALLCAYQVTGKLLYKRIAKESFDFLLSQIFNDRGIRVISNKSWLYKGGELVKHGEQPIDVAYTILALSRFYDVFQEDGYFYKRQLAFDWFLGRNNLHQIVYNPCTGGCYDGLERYNINLNQGAESTVSYLMARLSLVDR